MSCPLKESLMEEVTHFLRARFEMLLDFAVKLLSDGLTFRLRTPDNMVLVFILMWAVSTWAWYLLILLVESNIGREPVVDKFNYTNVFVEGQFVHGPAKWMPVDEVYD